MTGPDSPWIGEIILSCGHGWPGTTDSEAEARRFASLGAATDDVAMCPTCNDYRAITPKVRRTA